MTINNENDALLHWQARTHCDPPAKRCRWVTHDDMFLVYDGVHRFIGAVTPEGDCLDTEIVRAMRGMARG
ncbi:MAG: hypothetical protein JXR59_04020 [Desulfuromonadaceae bacterium]|nr:hypothetical protein [Desulfuromonadaceae bacterium]